MADRSARNPDSIRHSRSGPKSPVPFVGAAFVIASLFLLTGVAIGTAGAAETDPGPDSDDGVAIDTGGVHPLTTEKTGSAAETKLPESGCFAGEGRAFSIGTEGPRIAMRLHLSVLTDLGEPGSFGVELAGSTGQYDVVHLVAGVEFAGVEDADRFLRDPFDAFALVYAYELQLPMFTDASGVDPVHTEDEPPVDGPVGVSDC